MLVRPARLEDTEAVTDVLRRSIRDLCVADHGNRAEVLDGWLANKRPEVIAGWITHPNEVILVVEEDGAILAVGGVRRPDEILLNYVAPEARFRGVSKRLLTEMERLLTGFGSGRATLISTRTAHQFYVSAGYADTAAAEKFGMSSYAMTKDLNS